MNKKIRLTILLLLVAVLLIRLFSAYPDLVEKYYSNRLYPGISKILKYSFGWLPFSLGDILYGIAAAWLLFKILKLSVYLFRKKYSWQLFGAAMLKILILLLLIYVVFNSLWGLNYNRKGIADQLGIKMTKYSKDELVAVDSLLLQKVNESKTALIKNKNIPKTNREIFEGAETAYKNLGNEYSFCIYQPVSIKSSGWGWLGNYIGFTGYYNPFTGEAQVNTTVPRFLQPYIACHEIAHQLGYAKENEANFVGYLAAAAAVDTSFYYSVYLDLFLYTQRNLYQVDSSTARSFYKKMLPGVKDDLTEWKKFNQRYVNPMEPVFSWAYGKYLKSNEQPSGVLSYDEVTGFLIAYFKKFGKL